LLHDPGAGGMFGDVEVQDFSTTVRDYEEAVQPTWLKGPASRRRPPMAHLSQEPS
jgi:hypothetical protein